MGRYCCNGITEFYGFGFRHQHPPIFNATLLHVASLCGNERVTALLLERRASPNLQDNLGCTALHAAATFGHFAIVWRLLSAGARTDMRVFGTGHTPLQAATAGPLNTLDHTTAVMYLLRCFDSFFRVRVPTP